jgi:hypothetical protein
MDKDTKFALLVIGLPFLGLFYCAIIIFFLVMSPVGRNHPILTGAGFTIVPFGFAAYTWIRASAKAYQKKASTNADGEI